jgi:hypothetical protein
MDEQRKAFDRFCTYSMPLVRYEDTYQNQSVHYQWIGFKGGWKSRQPEIDALQSELDIAEDACFGEINRVRDFWKMKNENLQARIAELEKYLVQDRDNALEEAAVKATNWGNARKGKFGGHALRNCAISIRAMKSKL